MQAGGGTLRGGSGIVELVREIASQFAQGSELFSLLLDAGDFAHAIEEGGDDALRHGGNGREHRRKLGFIDKQRPYRSNGEALAAVELHAREGQQARHLPGAADEQVPWDRRVGAARESRP